MTQPQPAKTTRPPAGDPVPVFLADCEPIASFIASVARAEAMLSAVYPARVPRSMRQGVMALSAAVRRLRQAGVPITEEPDSPPP